MVTDILTHVALNGFDLNCACASVLHARSRATKTTQRISLQKYKYLVPQWCVVLVLDSQLKAHNGCTSPVSTLCTTNITYSTRGFQLEIRSFVLTHMVRSRACVQLNRSIMRSLVFILCTFEGHAIEG